MLVLIVDDEPIVAQTLGIIFHQRGFATEVVHSAEQASAFIQHTRPDLILCDIEMPVRDGLSLMEELARDLPTCPVLVLTGAYRRLNVIRATAQTLLQQFAILTKPCQHDELLRTASGLLRN